MGRKASPKRKTSQKRKRKKFILRTPRGSMKKFQDRLKPNEMKTREEQMRQFRYECAKITGNALYFFANIYLTGVFIIFVTMWLAGMYEGTQILTTFKESYKIWEDIISSTVPVLTPVSIMLVASVKMLSYDAKGRELKRMKIAMERSMYFMILIMISISVLYFDHAHWHI